MKVKWTWESLLSHQNLGGKSSAISNSHLETCLSMRPCFENKMSQRQNKKLFRARYSLQTIWVSEVGPSLAHSWGSSTDTFSSPPVTHWLVALGRENLQGIWIPDDKVAVQAYSYSPLARVQVEYLGSIGARHSHKLVFIHLPCGLLKYKDCITVPVSRSMEALSTGCKASEPRTKWAPRPRNKGSEYRSHLSRRVSWAVWTSQGKCGNVWLKTKVTLPKECTFSSSLHDVDLSNYFN